MVDEGHWDPTRLDSDSCALKQFLDAGARQLSLCLLQFSSDRD